MPTAKLPTVLRIAILFNVSSLPFALGNFSLPADQRFWNLTSDPDQMNEAFHGRVDPTTKEFLSSVQLIPNSSSVVKYDYIFEQAYETLFLDDYGEAVRGTRSLVFQFNRAGD